MADGLYLQKIAHSSDVPVAYMFEDQIDGDGMSGAFLIRDDGILQSSFRMLDERLAYGDPINDSVTQSHLFRHVQEGILDRRASTIQGQDFHTDGISRLISKLA
jgi:hypothetical protein